ncbi:MAG: hypothetical protein DRR19_25195 [Candidatus Parabeggiatoa sp. nov. 1]|nr:MAG: hypothetical protein DRR19_25195 [Gammaproteobacteria bacterium]
MQKFLYTIFGIELVIVNLPIGHFLLFTDIHDATKFHSRYLYLVAVKNDVTKIQQLLSNNNTFLVLTSASS